MVMNSMLPIFEGFPDSGLRIAGMVTREVAHRYGVPHGSALVAVVVGRSNSDGTEPCVVLQKRPAWKDICPGLWDIFGGHLEVSPALLASQTPWDQVSFIENLYAETAFREVNEECLVQIDRGTRRWWFGRQHLQRFGEIGEYACGLDAPPAPNREYSSFYGAFVPPEVLTLEANHSEIPLIACESIPVGGGSVAADIEVTILSWSELASRFVRSPGDYADGIARILSRAAAQPSIMGGIEEFFRMGLERAHVEAQ